MSIKKKVQKLTPEDKFVKKIENTLFDIIDTDDPVHTYMHTDVCKVMMQVNAENKFSEKYISGDYHLKQISNGVYNKTLEVIEALYETCMRFEKADMALIVTTEVMRCLLEFDLPLNWLDGKFQSKEIVL